MIAPRRGGAAGQESHAMSGSPTGLGQSSIRWIFFQSESFHFVRSRRLSAESGSANVH